MSSHFKTLQSKGLRLKLYKDNVRKTKLFDHVHLEECHEFLQDCSITLIDESYGSDPTRREEY